jgi:hypothetical protein
MVSFSGGVWKIFVTCDVCVSLALCVLSMAWFDFVSWVAAGKVVHLHIEWYSLSLEFDFASLSFSSRGECYYCYYYYCYCYYDY